MNSSEFIQINKQQLPYSTNRKSITTIVVIDGKKFFKKQLAAGYCENLRHRMAMYKEYEVGQRIVCPYIVRYISINEDENGLFVLMEHINGVNIAEKIEADPKYFCNHRNTEKMLKQLLKALKILHEKNIAYLDLKPENIMLTQVSNDVKLTDLGGCFTDSNDYTAERTQRYAAPELNKDQLDKVDARTDIYGIGRLLEHIEERTKSKLPKHLAKIKERCLHTEKAKRYETVNEIAKELNRKGKIIRNTLCCIALIVGIVAGWQWYVTTESYRIHSLYLKSDAIIECVCYAKSSEEELTCKVIGLTDWNILYLKEKVEIDGKLYTTTEIASSAFYGNKRIQSVFFPKGLRKVNNEAFYDCKRLVTVTLPEGVEELGHACFKGSGIRNLKLPKSLKSIGHASFAQCKNITELVIPEGVETLELDAFANCTNMKKIELPSTLKTISRGVFWYCESLEEVTIPAGVETIGEYVFYHCDSLKHVYNYSPNPQNLSVIFNRTDITLHVPANSVEEYQKAAHWNTLTIVGDL